MKRNYNHKISQLQEVQDHVFKSNDIGYLEKLKDLVSNFIFHFSDTGIQADEIRERAKELKKSIINKIDRLYKAIDQVNSTIKLEGLDSGYSLKQLSFIFEGLPKNHVKQSDKENFIAVFTDRFLPEKWAKVLWQGSRKRLHSFFLQMTGEQAPSMMNKYFIHTSRKPFDSNDKRKNKDVEISKLLLKAKNLK
jgi:hypothetical protein